MGNSWFIILKELRHIKGSLSRRALLSPFITDYDYSLNNSFKNNLD